MFNKIKVFLTILLILGAISIGAVGMFALPKSNIDNRKANVAIVNEDIQYEISPGVEKSYGKDLTNVYLMNTDGAYTATTRINAFDGLQSGVYDLVILIPADFSKRASSYDEVIIQSPKLEYYKNPNLTQVESLKSDVITKTITEITNKSLIKMYEIDMIKTMQSMQNKSLEILTNEYDYQKNFEDNVQKPMSESIKGFNDVLKQLSSQQEALKTFDQSVVSFQSSIESTKKQEEAQLKSFEELQAKYAETTKLVNEWSTNYSETLKVMNDGFMTQLDKLKLDDLIKGYKATTVKLEKQIVSLQVYKEFVDKMVNDMNRFATDTNVFSTYESIINYTDTDTDGQPITNASANEVKVFIDSLFVDNIEFDNATKIPVENAKKSIETNITDACTALAETLPQGAAVSDIQTEYDAAKLFCETAGAAPAGVISDTSQVKFESSQSFTIYSNTESFKIDNPDPNIKYYAFPEDLPYDVNNLPEPLDTTKTYCAPDACGTTGNISLDTVNGPGHSYVIYMKYDALYPFTNNEGVSVASVLPESNPTFSIVRSTGATQVIGTVNLQTSGQLVDDLGTAISIAPSQKEITKQLANISALTQTYYGFNVEQMNDPANASDYLGDDGQDVSGIRVFRKYHTSQSLIEQLFKAYEPSQLKLVIAKAYAQAMKTNYENVSAQIAPHITALNNLSNNATNREELKATDISQMQDDEIAALYIDKLSGSTGLYNEYIDQLTIRNNDLLAMQEQITQLNSDLNTLNEDTSEITSTHEEEGVIVASLNTNQASLLKGVEGLQKQVEGQLVSAKSISESSNRLKTDAETLNKTIEKNTEKLKETEKEFNETVSENGEFIQSFMNEYDAARKGGNDNNKFFNNASNPVTAQNNDNANANSLVPFFVILLLTVFSLIIGYYFSQMRIRRISQSDHDHVSMFEGVGLQLVFVFVTSLIASMIVAYIGIQALSVTDMVVFRWIMLILGIGTTLSLTFYALLLRFRTIGMMAIGISMLLYFITNGALGLSLLKNSRFTWLQYMNPLYYLEQPIQAVIYGYSTSLAPIFITLAVATIVSIIVIYALQPFVFKQEQKKA